MEEIMNNAIRIVSNDLDKIRKQLSRQELTYPGDSTDVRYRDFMNYVRDFNLPIELVEDFEWSHLGDEDHELSAITQCRDGNVDENKVADYAARFANGEKLNNPLIAVNYEGKYYIAFGNQRGKALRLSNTTTSIISVGKGLSYDEIKTIGLRFANISNRKTKLDVDTDDRAEILYQMQNEWNRVLGVDVNSKSPILEPYVKASKEYQALLSSGDEVSADNYKKLYFEKWFDEVKPDTLSSVEKTRKIQLGQYYSDAFSDDIKQRLTSGFHCGKEQETYNMFWSHLVEGENGEQLEEYVWNPETYSFANDAKTVQMDARCGNPLQNTLSSIWRHMYSGKICENVEIMLRPPTNMRDIKSINKWEANCRKVFKEFNTNQKHSAWGLPKLGKLIFLKHTTSDHETSGWEWKNTVTGGFFQKVEKII